MLIAGNWKMFKGPHEAREFCVALAAAVGGTEAGIEVAVCPPYVSLAAALAALQGSPVQVFAQSVHWAETGAFTGEVSAAMLAEVGVAGAVVGHSERRQFFGETDETVARRSEAALAAGLRVIACVGETLEERDGGRVEEVLRRQTGAAAKTGRRTRTHESRYSRTITRARCRRALTARRVWPRWSAISSIDSSSASRSNRTSR